MMFHVVCHLSCVQRVMLYNYNKIDEESQRLNNKQPQQQQAKAA